MNWTGGRLSRHSKKGGGALTERQKQHFATVSAGRRGGINKTGRPSPQKWTFLDQFRMDTGAERGSLTCSTGSRRPDEDEERRATPVQGTRDRQDSVRRSREHDADNDAWPGQGAIRRPRGISIQPKFEPPGEDEDLYDAPPPRKRDRESLPPATLLLRPAENSLEEKRRELLSKKDWVGTTYSQAPKMKFKSRDEDVGKRRKVTNEHRAQYSSRQATIGSPIAKRSRPLEIPIGNQRSSLIMREQATRSDVRISIGGRIVPPGFSSSSVGVGRRVRENAPRPTRKARSESSDVMLLDKEEVGDEMIESGFVDEEVYDADDGMSENLLDGIETQARNRYLQSHEAHEKGFFDAEIHHPEPRRPHAAPLLSRRFSSLSIILPSPSLRTIFEDSKRRASIISSPLNSTVARVGQPRPVVPQSQTLENEIWETWMAPSESSDFSGFGPISPGVSTGFARDDHDTSNELDVPERGDPDPDDSTFVEVSQVAEEMETDFSEIRHPIRRSRSPSPEEMEADFPDIGHPSRISRSPTPEEMEGPSQDSQSQLQYHHEPIVRGFEAVEPAQAVAITRTDEPGVKEVRETKRIAPDFGPKKLDAKATQDDIWMKFVFGSNSGSDDVGEEPRSPEIKNSHQARHGEKASSVIAHPGTTASGSSSRSLLSSTFAQKSPAFVGRSRTHSGPGGGSLGGVVNESVIGVRGLNNGNSTQSLPTSGSYSSPGVQSGHFPKITKPMETPPNELRFTPQSQSGSPGSSSRRNVFFRNQNRSVRPFREDR